MACMVCRKSDVKFLFNVGSNYGIINHTVGDDFVEIYGEKVKQYLTPDSSVCNVCINILDNVAILTRYIWSVISDPYNQPRPSKLNKFWKIFASLKLEGDEVDDDDDLLVQTYSVHYNVNLEKQIEEQERIRSLSIPPNPDRSSVKEVRKRKNSYFPSSASDKSGTDTEGYEKKRKKSDGSTSKSNYPGTDTDGESEVVKIFKRKKKRGHNWAKLKGGRSKSATSSVSHRSRQTNYTPRHTNYTPNTDISSSTSKSYSKRKLRALSFARTSSTHTRSLSRIEADASEKMMNIYCTERNCNMFSENIEELNMHNIEEHDMFNRYNCLECSKVYTTTHLFNIHMKTHTFSFFCLMCAMEQQNSLELQKHLDKHLDYSVSCKYCDKSFLSKTIRDEHIKQRHTGKRNRRIYKNRLILDRIDKCISSEEQTNRGKDEYEARFIYYTDMQVEDGDMDMAIENLKIKNIPVYTDEDEGITIEEEGFTSEDEVIMLDDEEVEREEECRTEELFQIEDVLSKETDIPVPLVEENLDET